jgi:hypothetical protein
MSDQQDKTILGSTTDTITDSLDIAVDTCPTIGESAQLLNIDDVDNVEAEIFNDANIDQANQDPC